jgi:hypothetical protein
VRQYRGNSDAARAALDTLAKAGIGRWTHPAPGSAGGRPSPRFELIGSATVTEAPISDAAEARIGPGDGGDAGGHGRTGAAIAPLDI